MLRNPMPIRHMTVKSDQVHESSAEVCDFWVVVTQDCDLAWSALVNDDDFLVELRPILDPEESPPEWGLRGHRFRLDEDGRYLDNRIPRLMVASKVVATSEFIGVLQDDRIRAMKTWLGKRYDRPALPAKYTDLAKRLVSIVTEKRNREIANKVRDILATFDHTEDVVVYKLRAVLPHPHKEAVPPGLKQEITEWLSGVSLKVPVELGVLEDVDALSAEEVSLDLLENSYSLEASKLTWPLNSPSPRGEE